MKSPHFATAVMAAMALSSGYTIDPAPDLTKRTQLPQRTLKNRMGLNQGQRRKNRRRAWAAGNRKAFD